MHIITRKRRTIIIITLHDNVLNPGELEGMAEDKSLEGALSRVEFGINYGMISDSYDLAAMYAVRFLKRMYLMTQTSVPHTQR